MLFCRRKSLSVILQVLAILGLLAVLVDSAQASSPVMLDGRAGDVEGRGHMAILRDPEGTRTLDEIIVLDTAGRFKPIPGNVGLGYTPDTIWLRMDLVLPEGAPERWLLEVMPSYLDHLDLYLLPPDGVRHGATAGDRLPFSARTEEYRNFLFPLHIPVGKSRLYLRVKSTSAMTVLPRFWQPSAFEHAVSGESALLGLYYGALLTVTFLNLIGFAINRQSIYLTYSGYVSLIGVHFFAIDGLLAQFALPDHPLIANQMLGATMGLGAIFGFRFYAQVLRLPGRFPWSDRVIWGMALLGGATAISAFTPYYSAFAPLLLLAMIASLLVFLKPLISLWRNRDAESRMIALAYTFYAGLLFTTLTASLGLTEPTKLSLLSSLGGSVIHFAILHSSLFLRAHRAQRDKLVAEAVAERARQEGSMEREMRIERERLLDMIGHEILTPVAVIDAANQTLRVLDTDTSPDRERRYDRIGGAVERLKAMLDLATHRQDLEADYSEPACHPINIEGLMQESVELLGPEGEKRVAVRSGTTLPSVQADERMLRFALLNLLDNAVKYSPLNSPIEVDVSRRSHEGRSGLCWSIVNDGAAIPRDIETTIFDKYVRGSEEAGQAGMGLGLYLTRYIFERHGGWVRLEENTKGRICFLAWLPTDTEQAGAKQEAGQCE
jgi:signal transduction histidine kinase